MSRLTHALAFGAGALLASVGAVSLLLPAAHAGVLDDNTIIRLHMKPRDTESSYELRLHRGNQSIDTVSTAIDGQEFFSLKAAAMQDQAAFDSTARTILGSTWYDQTAMTTTRKEQFRDAFLVVCQ